jgi:hypothetical protein
MSLVYQAQQLITERTKAGMVLKHDELPAFAKCRPARGALAIRYVMPNGLVSECNDDSGSILMISESNHSAALHQPTRHAYCRGSLESIGNLFHKV